MAGSTTALAAAGAVVAAAAAALAAGTGAGTAVAAGAFGGLLGGASCWWASWRLARQAAAVLRTAEAGWMQSERGQLERASAAELSAGRFAAVFESLGEAVAVVDQAGAILFANPAARRLMRPGIGQRDGCPLWEALGGSVGQTVRDLFERVRRSAAEGISGAVTAKQAAVSHRDRIYDVTAVPMSSPDGGADHGIVFQLIDMSHRQEITRLKDKFLSSVSHELRTPLTNICAYSEILRLMLPGESAEWPEFVRIIHEESMHLAGLVDSVFDYLQLEGGEVRFDMVDCDLRACTRRVVDRVQHNVGDAATVELVADPDLPAVRADVRRLEQVVSSLLDNAVKFSPAGGRVRLTLTQRDGCCLLRVEDEGPGVPEQNRETVFERFQQLRDHMVDKASGTGLGLAASKAIVGRLGGLIWCEDAALGGAAFCVLLPPATTVAEPAPASPAERPGRELTLAQGSVGR